MLSPAGLVGFSAGRRLQKVSTAPRALARLQLCAAFRVIGYQDNQYFVEVKIQG